MQDQTQQLQQQLTDLKARLFDSQEQVNQMTQFQNAFFGQLAQLLGLPQDQQNDPNAYLQAVHQLVAGPAPIEAEVVAE